MILKNAAEPLASAGEWTLEDPTAIQVDMLLWDSIHLYSRLTIFPNGVVF